MASTVDIIPETDLPRTRTRGRTSKSRSAAAKQAAAPKASAAVLTDSNGAPKTVPLNNFFGVQRQRAFIKLDADQKALKNRQNLPELPNEAMLDWSVKNKYKAGGIKGAPISKSRTAEQDENAPLGEGIDGLQQAEAAHGVSAADMKRPARVKRAWEYYAEVLIEQALKANPEARSKGEEKAIRQAICEQVMPSSARGKSVAARNARKSEEGDWHKLRVEERNKYADMWQADVERFRREMQAYKDSHPDLAASKKSSKAVSEKKASSGKQPKSGSKQTKAEPENDENNDEVVEDTKPASKGTKRGKRSGKAASKAAEEPEHQDYEEDTDDEVMYQSESEGDDDVDMSEKDASDEEQDVEEEEEEEAVIKAKKGSKKGPAAKPSKKAKTAESSKAPESKQSKRAVKSTSMATVNTEDAVVIDNKPAKESKKTSKGTDKSTNSKRGEKRGRAIAETENDENKEVVEEVMVPAKQKKVKDGPVGRRTAAKQAAQNAGQPAATTRTLRSRQ